MMQNDRILVTGANGFVGQWLIPEIRKAMPKAVIIGTATTPSSESKFLQLDVRDESRMLEIVNEFRPTRVVNLAALSAIQEAEQDAGSTYAVNMLAPARLAEAAAKACPECRFLFISSSEVYGGTFREWGRAVDETAPIDPLNLYAAAKAAGEIAIGVLAHRGLTALRFRPFNHTGPGQSERFALAAFVAQIDRIERGQQEPIVRVGNLDAERDYVDVRDIVAGYVAALLCETPLPPGLILNLASGRPVRIGDLLDHLLSRARVAIRVERDESRMRPSETPLVLGNADRARDVLGWQPRISIEQTLDDMLQARRQLSEG